MKLQLILCSALAVTLFESCSGVRISYLKLSNCKQSSTSAGYICDFAIDGNTNQNLVDGSCTLSTNEATGWWKADTGRPAIFVVIKIFNRQDCCAERLTNFTIYVGANVCDTYNGRVFSVRNFPCTRRLFGTELKISSSKPHLSLCEVVALGGYIGKRLKLSNCKQSSTEHIELYGAEMCRKAIDGNTNQNLFPGYQCSRAGFDATGWWKAETDIPALIRYVQIYNRQDCCADSLTNFTISVNDEVCYTHDGTTFSVKLFRCRKKGTVLKIASSKPYLTLCEVIASGKKLGKRLKLSNCKQSSKLWNGLGLCHNAIDGDTNQYSEPGYRCSHTGSEASGWWKAEIDRPALIKYVEIHNRQDCCADRLTNFKISADDNVCYTHDGTIFSIKVFRCFKNGTVLKIESSKPYLTLCEVIATGKYLDKKLKLLRCNQSSEFAPGIGVCQKAIDGDTVQNFMPGNRCSHAGGEATGWWTAHFNRPVSVKLVRIYNRQDCCADRLTDFKVSVDDKVCYTHDGTIFSTKLFRCLAEGLMLKIESNKPYLTLCEVIASGEFVPDERIGVYEPETPS